MSGLKRYPDLDYHLLLLLEGGLGPEDLARLEKAILEDAETAAYCIDYLTACAVMRRSSVAAAGTAPLDIMDAISQGRKSRPPRVRRVRRWLYAAAAVLAIGLCVWMARSLRPTRPEGPVLGTLTETRQAVWAGTRRPLAAGEALYWETLHLRQGVAQIELGQGARVLIQAPSVFRLDGPDTLTLFSGKLTASVEPRAGGFTVHTKSAVLTDLGTEFGVIAEPKGRVEAHVFKGRVIVGPSRDALIQEGDQYVDAGEAVIMLESGAAIRASYGAQPALFIRTLPAAEELSCPGSRLNLADIVGGGSGFGTGAAGAGIDLLTGHAVKRSIRVARQTQQSKYTPAVDRRYIDGVFVPNARDAEVVVSSTGLIWKECYETLGICYEGVTNTAEQTLPGRPDAVYPGRLRGVEYGTPGHPALNLHPNAGITFDLDAIRAANLGVRIERFTALCGMAEDIPQPRSDPAHVWVLVDGTVRFELHIPWNESPSEAVNIPIAPEARFLTLVSTSPGNPGLSWIFFGDPTLELRLDN